jgi:hypothetical protein
MSIVSTRAEVPPRGLSRKLATFLASAEGADREAVEAAIALLPLGARLTLAALQIIDTLPEPEVQEAADRGEPTDFNLTDEGLDVIRECAYWFRSSEEDPNDQGRLGRVVGAVRSFVPGL